MWIGSSSVRIAGETLNTITVKPIATAKAKIIWPRVISPVGRPSSPSSMDATLAEMASARKPMASDSPSATTPRITGSRSQRRREAGLVTGLLTHETPPSGRRTATDHDDGVRIITPSRTA